MQPGGHGANLRPRVSSRTALVFMKSSFDFTVQNTDTLGGVKFTSVNISNECKLIVSYIHSYYTHTLHFLIDCRFWLTLLMNTLPLLSPSPVLLLQTTTCTHEIASSLTHIRSSPPLRKFSHCLPPTHFISLKSMLHPPDHTQLYKGPFLSPNVVKLLPSPTLCHNLSLATLKDT